MLEKIQDKLEKLELKQIELDVFIKNKNFEKIIDNIHNLDLRLKSLEIYQKDQDQNWRSIINFIVQIIWVVMAAYILLKLGLTEGMGPL